MRQYKLEIRCCLRTVTEFNEMIQSVLNRTLNAMHDSGCFSEELVDELLTLIFAHYERAKIIEQAG